MMRRRATALLALLSLTLAACTASDAGAPNSSEATEPSTTTTTEVTLPPPTPYQPLDGEPAPDAKKVASDALQAVGTYDEGAGTVAGAVQRLGALGDPAAVDAAAGLLVPDASSTVEIVYPQLAGLTDTQASVMVVARHRLLREGEETSVTRTVDVRLVRGQAGWTVSTFASLGGDPVPAPAISPSARAVLDSDAIDMPDSARWDIEAGRIDDRVLDLLLEIAEKHTLSVAVFASGHPLNVFGSASVSNHTEGRAVDIWAVDGVAVVSQRDPAGALHALVSELVASEAVTELGAPWDLDAGAGVSFANTVHQDHLHLAFDR